MKVLILLLYMVTSIAMACKPEQICPQDIVLDKFGYVGEVLEVFHNDTAHVKYKNGYSTTVNTSDLAKSVSCFENICDLKFALYRNLEFVTVFYLFSNGMAQVYLHQSDSFKIVRIKHLLPSVCSENENICLEFVLNKNNGLIGTVVGLFPNGLAVVRYTNSKTYSIVKVQNLVRSVECIENICAVTFVWDKKNGYLGFVQHVFSNGMACIIYSPWPSKFEKIWNNLWYNRDCKLVDIKTLVYNEADSLERFDRYVEEVFGKMNEKK